MKLALATLFTLLCTALVSHAAAEENKIVKVYTLKDGRMVIAMRSMSMTSAGKTSYTVTDVDGRKVSFDDSQVEKVEEEAFSQKYLPERFKAEPAAPAPTIYAHPLPGTLSPFADATAAAAGVPASAQTPSSPTPGVPNNVEPYAGPNLGMQPDNQDLRGGSDGAWTDYGTGSYMGWFGGRAYVLDRTGLHALPGNVYAYRNAAGYQYGAYAPGLGMHETVVGSWSPTGGVFGRNTLAYTRTPVTNTLAAWNAASSHRTWMNTPVVHANASSSFGGFGLSPGASSGFHQSSSGMHSSLGMSHSSGGGTSHMSSGGGSSMGSRK